MKKDKIFLNRPIQNEEEDWIGISTYVDVLDGAVEAGAKIIAVTSDFGTGKSSLISLYQKKYRNKKKKILNINLWGTYDHQTNGQELLPIELHKSFLYQTVNQLYPPIWGKGSYISKRLSKDYGIISISGRNLIQAILTIVAIVLGLSGFFALKFREVIAVFWGKPEIDFGEERIRQVVKEEADWIAENALDSFERIRKLILAKHGLIEDYKELFCPPYVHLSADELALIENCTDALSIIENRSMTMKSGEDVVNYFNQKKRKTTETYELVRYIARQNKLVAERMFYKMNLSKLPYHRMAKARIREINDLFYDLFEMEDKPEEKVKFLSFVGVSDEKMEKNLYEDLNSDEELRDKYVGYANKLDTVGKSTIDNIVGLSTVLTYSKAINDKLYSLGYYTQYVSSKTSLEKGFEVEEERRDILWPIYVKMFHSPFRQRIRGLMSANEDFLQELITEKEYEKAGDALGHYKVALQTNALLAYVFEQLSDEKLCEYLQGVCGFKDRNAAHFCLELLKERQAVAAKVQVYQNLHGKFVEPGLEGWLTKIWKKAKKGQN